MITCSANFNASIYWPEYVRLTQAIVIRLSSESVKQDFEFINEILVMEYMTSVC